jgi:O-antigen ligase
LHMFLDHPLLGVGIGNYADAYPQYFITIFTDPLGHAHNYYINIAAETGSIGLIAFALFLLAVFVAGWHSLQEISKKWRRAHAQLPQSKPVIQAPLGRDKKLKLLVRPLSLIQYYRGQEQFDLVRTLTNDRALAIGLLAALIAICIHNLVDDLFVHSITNLIALLLIALIRLERVTPDLSV